MNDNSYIGFSWLSYQLYPSTLITFIIQLNALSWVLTWVSNQSWHFGEVLFKMEVWSRIILVVLYHFLFRKKLNPLIGVQLSKLISLLRFSKNNVVQGHPKIMNSRNQLKYVLKTSPPSILVCKRKKIT